ncbi:MAG TPA: nicotinate phosphoribosyltransferase [Candidatus Acidoferrales bacterium]|nr:nicotinate phosphoribosyltransferase [Candidatus Acidoferrales bacterium]
MESPPDLALLTDLYELTMAQSYFQARKFERATFSLFIRAYPPRRGYFVTAGLEDVLRFLEGFSFDAAHIDFLSRQKLFTGDFLDYLKSLRFTGEVWAIPEGRLAFRDEPLLEVTAPIIEAQIVETFIINQINLQTLIATKAARCVHAAAGRAAVDFSLRRTHGTDAGMKVARASYLAGFAGTSNVLAGMRYGIPIVGTMAHSFVSSFEHEIDAFRQFVASFPANSILLIDTYDTLEGARRAVQVAREMAARGERLQGVRIDSGDLAALAHAVRRIFDDAGFKDVKIIGSGGLDEYDLARLDAAGAPFDSYGIGTQMGVSADAPWFDIAYKLVEHNGRPVVKLSTGKVSIPGAKQVFRFTGGGVLEKDLIALRQENVPGAEPLLKRVMEGGKIVQPLPSLNEIREGFLAEFARLDPRIKAIHDPALYPVELTPELRELRQRVERQLASSLRSE